MPPRTPLNKMIEMLLGDDFERQRNEHDRIQPRGVAVPRRCGSVRRSDQMNTTTTTTLPRIAALTNDEQAVLEAIVSEAVIQGRWTFAFQAKTSVRAAGLMVDGNKITGIKRLDKATASLRGRGSSPSSPSPRARRHECGPCGPPSSPPRSESRTDRSGDLAVPGGRRVFRLPTHERAAPKGGSCGLRGVRGKRP